MTTEKTLFSTRNIGIDMLRALTMCLMIFVNNFWNVTGMPHWMEHAGYGEDFMGLSDIVFPTFLFVVGMSIPYAIERRYSKGLSTVQTLGHIIMRTFALWAMGVVIGNTEFRLSPDMPYDIGVYWTLMVIGFLAVWNNYPRTDDGKVKWYYRVIQVLGVGILLFLVFTYRSPEGHVFIDYPSILGLIAWSYCICALVYLFTRDRLDRLVPAGLVLLLVSILCTPLRCGEAILHFPEGNVLDSFLHALHIDNGTLVAFTMAGVIWSVFDARMKAGEYGSTALPSRRLLTGLAAAAVSLVLGFIAHQFWIVSKIEATPTWFFWVCAIAIGGYSILDWLAVNGVTGWFRLIKPAGTATLTAYMVPYFLYGLRITAGITIPAALCDGAWVGTIHCLVFTALCVFVTWLFELCHVKLKI